MSYPIVQVKTKDQLWLHGLFLRSDKSKTILINIHGTASNFYEEYFIEVMADLFLTNNISILSTNNRGVGVYDPYQGNGAATEKFEDCVYDIDAWLGFALSEGFQNIILSGHSLGTEKVVYYMGYGKYSDKVSAIVLLAPADSYGSHRLMDGHDNIKVHKDIDNLLKESEILIEKGNKEVFLPRYSYGSHGGIMPKTPESLINFLGADSEILKALPFATRKLETYSKIKVPILVAIGDQQEYTALTVAEALELMKKENSLTEVLRFRNCNHDFEDCEDELAKAVLDFIKKHAK